MERGVRQLLRQRHLVQARGAGHGLFCTERRRNVTARVLSGGRPRKAGRGPPGDRQPRTLTKRQCAIAPSQWLAAKQVLEVPPCLLHQRGRPNSTLPSPTPTPITASVVLGLSPIPRSITMVIGEVGLEAGYIPLRRAGCGVPVASGNKDNDERCSAAVARLV
jgi:hypothetical protein